MSSLIHLPSFLHQNSAILITTVRTGRLHCKLSIASSIFERTKINECVEGTNIPIIVMKNAKNARKSHINFSRKFRFELGHNPITCKLKRCSLIAQSKSSFGDSNESNSFVRNNLAFN